MKNDVHLQNVQQTLLKATFALLQISDAMVTKNLGGDKGNLIANSVDAVVWLSHAHTQLSQMRKDHRTTNPVLLPLRKFHTHDYPILEEEVNKVLRKEIITKVPCQRGQIVSGIFLRSKKGGSCRLILNLK